MDLSSENDLSSASSATATNEQYVPTDTGEDCTVIGNDSVTQTHECTVTGDCIVTVTTEKQKQSIPAVDWQSERLELKDSMRYILDSGEYSDVTFLVGEKRERVKGHKLILMSRSAVFEAMFQRWELGEKVEVVIEDADLFSFRLFMTYLYTGTCTIPRASKEPESSDLIESTLYLGHKYNLKGLVTLCANALLDYINANTAAKYYTFGVTYDIADIKKWAMTCIRRKDEVFTGNGIFDWNLDTLTEVLCEDYLKTSEIVLFQAVVRWADNACKNESLESTPGNYRTIAEKAFFAIRYPLMTLKEFTDQVVNQNEGLLTDREVIQVYRLMSASNNTENETSANFNCTPRVLDDVYSDDSFTDADESFSEDSISDYSSVSDYSFDSDHPRVSIGLYESTDSITIYNSMSDSEDDTVSISSQSSFNSSHSHMSGNDNDEIEISEEDDEMEVDG